MTTDGLVAALRDGLGALADPTAAVSMAAYMKSVEAFCGVPKPPRERLLRAVLADHPLPDAATLAAAADLLWDGARFREERYLALALVAHRRHTPMIDVGWLPRLRRWIVEGAWWDTTDELANRHVGRLLRARPAELTPVLHGWARDPDRWLRRTSVICQLSCGAGTDLDLLTAAIDANADDPEFFLRKAIGWALRQHARTDPDWVRAFVAARPALSPLARREALRALDA